MAIRYEVADGKRQELIFCNRESEIVAFIDLCIEEYARGIKCLSQSGTVEFG